MQNTKTFLSNHLLARKERELSSLCTFRILGI
uniref:Uncharacterized protein n=1 Tax=Rhizophora mucronata TaxID=61149 RepID=A0A2P2MM83_RHIMU